MDKCVIDHSYKVAEYMYREARYNKDEMYILGLLHDIGKMNGFENHEQNGFLLLKNVGFKYVNEIAYHGKVQSEYKSYELDLLNAADLSVDKDGVEVGYVERIKDIGVRYGFDSKEYMDAVILSEQLVKKGFL